MGFISNGKGHNTNNRRPDARVKTSPEDKKTIVDRVNAGETQAQVAADFGITQPQVSNVVTKANEGESVPSTSRDGDVN